MDCGQEDTYWRGSLTSPEAIGLLLLHWVPSSIPELGEDTVPFQTLLSTAQASSPTAGSWSLQISRNDSTQTIALPVTPSNKVRQEQEVLDTFVTCDGSTLNIIAAPLIPDPIPVTNLNDVPPLHVRTVCRAAVGVALCWSNIWSSLFHTPGEQSLYDASGSYLLYYLFQARFTASWPELPIAHLYTQSTTNITAMFTAPDVIGKVVAQFADVPDDEPGQAFTLSGLYALPGGYCLEGLLQAGSINTMAGEMLGEDVLLQFSPGPSDTEFLVVMPSKPDAPPVSGYILSTACYTTIVMLNDTLQLWETADIPRVPAHSPWPAAAQHELFHVAPNCGEDDLVVPRQAVGSNNVAGQQGGGDSDGSSLSPGAIAGIVLGSVAGCALLVAVAFFVLWPRRRQTKNAAAATKLSSPGTDETSKVSYATFLSISSDVPAFAQGILAETAYTYDTDPTTGQRIVIGHGRFGVVYAGHSTEGELLAIKHVLDPGAGTAPLNYLSRLRKEIDVLRLCRSRYIVTFMGVTLSEPLGEVRVVTERMVGGDLWRELREGRVSWARNGWRIALDVASGLVYLSDRHVVHNDLKSSNILLSGSGRAKISDVGLARIVPDSRSYLPSQSAEGGSFNWCAPEAILGEPSTAKSDMFSFGVVLWELITGDVPVRSHMRAVRTPEECPAEVAALMEQCWERRPEARPAAQDAVWLLQSLYASGEEEAEPDQ